MLKCTITRLVKCWSAARERRVKEENKKKQQEETDEYRFLVYDQDRQSHRCRCHSDSKYKYFLRIYAGIRA